MYALIDSNNFFVSCERLFRPDLTDKPVVVLSSNDGCVVSRSNEAKALGIKMGEPAFSLRHRFADVRVVPGAMQTRAQRGRPAKRAGGMRAGFERSNGSTQRGVDPSSKNEYRQHQIVMFSANFELYGDISERISSLLTSITPHIENYSIDEAFLDLDQLDITDLTAWGRAVRVAILRGIGIPVSIGIAPTKTLCKLAAHWAKQHPETQGVFHLSAQTRKAQAQRGHERTARAAGEQAAGVVRAGFERSDDATRRRASPSSEKEKRKADQFSRVFQSTDIADVWGVGRRLAPRLKAEGIFTALDLAGMSPRRAQQVMGIHGRHMVYELGGTRCLPLQTQTKPQQVISRGRQFGEDTSDVATIEAAIVALATRAAAELRREHQLAHSAAISLRTSRHKPGYSCGFARVRFAAPTADTGTICSQLMRALRQTFRTNLSYHKAEVSLYNLTLAARVQTDVFGTVDAGKLDRETARMQALDTINAKHGTGSLRLAAETLSDRWQPRRSMLSPRYTSEWSHIPEASCRTPDQL